MMFLLEKLLCFLILVIPILISVAYLTLAESKIMGSMQQRKGPNVIGFLGLLQPLADGLKLLIKETVIPTNASTFSFIFAPVLTLFLSLFGWSMMPFSSNSFYVDIDMSLLFIFAVSSLGVYGIMLSGWSSNSRYAFFGSLSSASQMVSYEVSMGLILMIVLVCVGSLNFFSMVLFQEFLFFLAPLFPIFFMFLVSILAETNSAPFDLPEAESELVSGYNVEYASMGFALFFLAEYSSMMLMSALTTMMFIGGWISVFPKPFILDSFVLSFKISIMLFFFIWVRASFPSYSIDQLMRLCWKVFLPISLSFVLITFSLLWCFNGIL